VINAGGLGFWIYRQNLQPAGGAPLTESATAEEGAVPMPADNSSLFSTQQQSQGRDNEQEIQEQLTRNLAALEKSDEAPVSPKTADADVDSEPAPSRTGKSARQENAPTQSVDKPNVIFSDEPLTVSPSELQNAETVKDASALRDIEFAARQDIPAASEEAGDSSALKVYEIAELPTAVKRNLPEISFAGHVYSSTASQRSVMLNGKKMREGQEVSKGLLLEEITIDGVILRSQGYRFKLGALQDWSF